MAALLSAFGGGPADRSPGGPGEVAALPGVGEKGELAVAAGAALRLLERGFSPEELVVVSSAPRRVAPRLLAAFKERGLSLAVGRGEAAAEVPLLRLVLELMAMTGGLERSAAVRLMGSGWLPAGGGVAGLPALLDRSGALDGRGRAAAALRRRAGALSGRGLWERARLQKAAEQIEELEGALSPLAAPASARDHARRLSAVVGALGLKRRAMRGPLQVAARDLAALAALDAAAEEVVLAAALCGRGAALLSPSWFRALLGLSLESLALPSAGDPVAGAVELLSPDELGGPPSRAAIVLGCGEGVFAAPAPPEPLLREPERQAINRRLRRQALATAGARRAEALHRAFLSAAAGSEVVAFAWAGPGPSATEGSSPPSSRRRSPWRGCPCRMRRPAILLLFEAAREAGGRQR